MSCKNWFDIQERLHEGNLACFFYLEEIIKIYANIIDDITLLINNIVWFLIDILRFPLVMIIDIVSFHLLTIFSLLFCVLNSFCPSNTLTLVFSSQILIAAVERLAENGLLDPDAIVRSDEDTLANLIKPVSCNVVQFIWRSTNCYGSIYHWPIMNYKNSYKWINL
jgi:hypothetical protein